MNPVLSAAAEIERFFRTRHWKFCIIGGLAVTRWGNPRATEDVDVSLLIELGSERSVIDQIVVEFPPRAVDAADFALESRVLLVKASNGINIDVGLAAFPFEKEIVERATKYTFDKGVRLTTASAEDLILMKLLAGRPRDRSDVADIAACQAGKLDWLLIERQLHDLREAFDVDDAIEYLKELRSASAPKARRKKRP